MTSNSFLMCEWQTMRITHKPINMPPTPTQGNQYPACTETLNYQWPDKGVYCATEADAIVKYSIYFLINPLLAWQNPSQWHII